MCTGNSCRSIISEALFLPIIASRLLSPHASAPLSFPPHPPAPPR
ncbi:hypothetical protein [Nitratidesulfovibrio sp. 1201_IL3209]